MQVTRRPWGEFQVLLDEDYIKVKLLTIHSGQRLSYQYHNKRAERWIVVKGNAHAILDGMEYIILEGNSLRVPVKTKHRLWNKSSEDVKIIEVQTGEYFGEDDIVRIEDDYSRV